MLKKLKPQQKTQPTMISSKQLDLNTSSTEDVRQQSLDDADWSQPLVKEEEEEYEDDDEDNGLVSSFEEMGLKRETLQGLFRNGIDKPSECQTAAKVMIDNIDRSIVIQARTGSGKTIAFLIVSAQIIEMSVRHTQVIILAPTRELALQIYDVAINILEETGITIAIHRGTSSRDETVRTEGDKYLTNATGSDRGREQIVIGTPARLLALMTKETYVKPGYKFKIDVNYVQQIVFDEVDKILDSSHNRGDSNDTGMAADARRILDRMNDYTRRMYFTATLSTNVALHVRNEDPMVFQFNDVVGKSITHYYVSLGEEEAKLECLDQVTEGITNAGSIIVFASSIMMVTRILSFLRSKNYSVDALHARMTQSARDKVVHNFRHGHTRILISTDVAARGIDITSVDLVFNYDLPDDSNIGEFVHRAGRAGRYGRVGIAITFIVEATNAKPADIIKLERTFAISISPLPRLDMVFN